MPIIRPIIAEQESILSTAFSRFVKMGALAGKIGFSLIGEKALGLFLSPESKEMRQIKLWVKNGDRILETLGSLKGGVMKIGQMLSLQEGLFPPEFLAILKQLQQSARPVKSDVMMSVLAEDIPHYQQYIQHIEPTPFASASIGQVHKAILHDGRTVAIKIQYPGMDKIILSDLKNLKILFKLLFENMTSADLTAVWDEISERLSEELDYRIERNHQLQFTELLAEFSWLKIPKPVDELCSAHVLTTEFHSAMRMTDAVARAGQSEKDLWGKRMMILFLEQLLRHSMIHADPNTGNYGFDFGGNIVLYDFGSVKKVPEWLRSGYLSFINACVDGNFSEIPSILKTIKVQNTDQSPVQMKHVDFYVNLLSPVFTQKPYAFSADNNLVSSVIKYNQQNLEELGNLEFPADVIFVDRTIAGLVGNLNQLGASGNWGEYFTEFLKKLQKN